MLLAESLQNLSDPLEFLGENFNGFEVDEDMAGAVGKAAAEIRRMESYFVRKHHAVRMEIERHCDLTRYGVEGMEGGHADVVLKGFGANGACESLAVIDYKHGMGVPVYPRENPQLMMYALGAMDPEALAPKEVTLAIAQPRQTEWWWRQWSVGGEALRDWGRDTLVPRALMASGDGAKALHASEEACRWCRARTRCPELMSLAKRTDEISASALKPDDKAWLVENGPLIARFIADVTSDVESEMREGSNEYAARLKLVAGRKIRKWNADAREILLDFFGNDALNLKLKGLGAIEKLLRDRMGTKDAKLQMERLTDVSSSPPKAVPVSDRREALILPQADFAEELSETQENQNR